MEEHRDGWMCIRRSLLENTGNKDAPLELHQSDPLEKISLD